MEKLKEKPHGRNSNLELLRILSMLLIVAHHYTLHGIYPPWMEYSPNKYFVGLLTTGGKIGVICFVLISGYFMSQGKFTMRKGIRLAAETWFYSVTLFLLFSRVLTPQMEMDANLLVGTFLPLGRNTYWFVTHYFVLLLLSPALNAAIAHIEQQTFRKVLISFAILWSVIPFASSMLLQDMWQVDYTYSIWGWFVILYLLAGYLRKYVDLTKTRASKHFMVAGAGTALMFLITAILIYCGNRFGFEYYLKYGAHVMDVNSPLVVLISVELFLGFAAQKPRENKVINTIAGTTLGVYLIHDNPQVRHYLWNTILKTGEVQHSPMLWLYAILSVLGVFVVCSGIDWVRQCTVERWFMKLVDYCTEKTAASRRKLGQGLQNLNVKITHWYQA